QHPQRMGDVLSSSALRVLGRTIELYDLHRIKLGTYELLKELLLEFKFYSDLGIKHSAYQERTAELVDDFLQSSNHKLESLNDEALLDVLDAISENIDIVDAKGSASVSRIREYIGQVKATID